jgi:hypothetical protein
MPQLGSEVHRRQAERAERRAEEARRRVSTARAAAERHDRLVETSDAVRGELHVRGAALQRDAQAVFERAAALQQTHAAHERRLADSLTPTGSATGERAARAGRRA